MNISSGTTRLIYTAGVLSALVVVLAAANSFRVAEEQKKQKDTQLTALPNGAKPGALSIINEAFRLDGNELEMFVRIHNDTPIDTTATLLLECRNGDGKGQRREISLTNLPAKRTGSLKSTLKGWEVLGGTLKSCDVRLKNPSAKSN